MSKTEHLEQYKKKFRQPKKVVIDSEPEPEPEPESESEPEPEQEPEPEPGPGPEQVKQKKPRSVAQLAAFEKAQATRLANAQRRRKEKEEADREYRHEVEDKLVRKAIAVKKRQIRQQMIIDNIPELDDVDDEAIKKVVAKGKKKVVFI